MWIDSSRTRHRFLDRDDVQTTLVLFNRVPVQQQGELHLLVRDLASWRTVLRSQQRVSVAPGQTAELELSLPARPGLDASVQVLDTAACDPSTTAWVVPYLLTPSDPPTPTLHGARQLGARPGSPLHHRVPATGQEPLRYEAQGLPAGLVLDTTSGLITGTVPAAGSYAVQLTVSNALASAQRGWMLVAGEQLALTPPLGWNSWNAHGANVSDGAVRAAAQALVDQGLAAKGWNGALVDDGWQTTQRLQGGTLPAHAGFPDMPAQGQFLHTRGLRFGLFASAATTTCSGRPGSLDFEARDLATWLSWGVDELKVETCAGSQAARSRVALEDHQRPLRLLGDLLRTQPRSVVYNLSQHGEHRVWTWGAEVGAQRWRMAHGAWRATYRTAGPICWPPGLRWRPMPASWARAATTTPTC